MKRSGRLPRTAPLPRSGIRRKPRPAAETQRIYGGDERLGWLHSLPCIITGQYGVECVHVKGGGGSRKANYRWTVPMNPSLHRVLHTMGVRSFEKRYGIDLKGAAVATEIAWRKAAPPAYLHTTDPLCATCGASFREDGDQCASCAYPPCDSDS